MDYEKKYKEALEKARQLCAYPTTKPFISDLQDIFPELKESKDEKIRKDLVKYFEAHQADLYFGESKVKKILAYLEKQGEQKPTVIIPKFRVGDEIRTANDESLTITKIDEKGYWSEDLFICGFDDADKWELVEQKPADKVEPKFHEGEWLCENEPNNYARFIQILEIVNVQGKERYRISRDIHNDEDIVEFDFVEKYYHKFGIQDAKDGDVLVMQKTDVTYESIFIFKKIENDCIIQYLHYFITDAGEKVCEARSIDGFLGFVGTTVHPSTKEQRDTIMKAMADAGYAFDFEKKELKKFEQKPAECGEDDEKLFDKIGCLIHAAAFANCETDENGEELGEYAKMMRLLKSLKDKYTWKPSERQKEALLWCVVHLGGADKQTLGELLEELNKL